MKVVTFSLTSQSYFPSLSCHTHMVSYRNKVINRRVQNTDELVHHKMILQSIRKSISDFAVIFQICNLKPMGLLSEQQLYSLQLEMNASK